MQSTANVLMAQASVVKFDFGLRAIKAIIGIAENLKQQVQNIWESDLPDIVNEDALDRVPWKSDQIIKDVQDEVDPMPEDFVAAEEQKRDGRSPTKKRAAPSMASEIATGDIGHNSIDEDDESIFSKTITEEISDPEEDEDAEKEDRVESGL